MKYGQHLRENIAPEYGPEPYLNYAHLDGIIRILSGKDLSSADMDSRQVSLTTPAPTNKKGIVLDSATITEEAFISSIDSELTKVEHFTLRKVTDLRNQLDEIEQKLKEISLQDEEETDSLQKLADDVASKFLTLEKYVNLNFMGFHKILKKHDKYCSSAPCKTFYINRMHSQAWVRGDYSDVVVRLSAIYSALRNDQVAEENNDASQSFLRSTTKYWIKTEDVSKVKYAVLRNLPVFLQKTSTGESDSQLTNSVYLDNDQLELYHGRLDKTQGALALRLRWYGAAEPSIVFVERKTHRDKWIGEVSVKERFMVKEKEVQQVLTNTYPIKTKKEKMIKEGSTQDEADDWECLASEITQAISSKQLVPTMRTQYMRTAFQIPFDATVRVSLDTNLCMISERGYDLKNMTVWHRDPNQTIAHNEITRFPHAVLEIKLELKGENAAPPKWVTDLQNSGLLYEVHKFSKFIHGCAVMMPEDVRAVPYWVDDASLRQSIIASGGGRILVRDDMTEQEKKALKLKHPGSGPGANQVYDHLLPFGDIEDNKVNTATGRTNVSKLASKGVIDNSRKYDPSTAGKFGSNFYDDDLEEMEEEQETCMGWLFPFCSPYNNMSVVAPTSVQKIEPKIFFANERTFLHWLHAGITLYSIASAILVFSEDGASWAHWYAMALLPIALGFCMYALHVFLWRADRIKTRIPGRWDDPRGPYVLGGLLVIVLSVNFITKLEQIWDYESMEL
ncbi:hypothetical protein CTEN210_01030 [Chaetoceros tenuissimus]|uniref:SPX domain-containing protein n=1 Tax=Chaetoceros tenuissimus TaxID=426638 RepID=A0AAD3CGT9_9STRA|nr:hypothetical protein CTEN210_01030 [Chaetoceros tenuissimus]